MKYVFIAYKPSSSHANCRCGCSGYTEYESDFCSVQTSYDDLENLFYDNALENLKMQDGEAGYAMYVYSADDKVFELSIDGFVYGNDDIIEIYIRAANRAKTLYYCEQEKKKAAELEELRKKEELKAAIRRKQYEELKKEFEDKNE